MGKAFEKQIKTIEDQGKKRVDVLNTLKSNNQLTIALNNDEAKKELDKMKEIEKNVDREKLIYEADEYAYTFKNFQTTKTFGRDIYKAKITMKEADEYQADLLTDIKNFRKNKKQRSQEKKREKETVFQNFYNFFLMCLGILNPDHSKLKILSPKQMLQRLPIALAQVKAGNNSESF